MQQTSLEAYRELRPKVGERHAEVLRVLKHSPIALTDTEIARELRKSDPNYIRPRRNELASQGIIMSVGKRECRVTGKTCLIWRRKVDVI